MRNRHFFRIAVAALLVALSPAVMSQERSRGRRASRSMPPAPVVVPTESTSPKAQQPTRGVRFVMCSASGARLPELYAKLGDEYQRVLITSRMPTSQRIPVNAKGKVLFYDKEPSAKTEKTLEPFISIDVPADCQNKSVCILVPNKDGKVAKSYFLKDTDFPQGAAYVVNFSHTPLEMVIYNPDEKTGKKAGKNATETPGEGSKSEVKEEKARIAPYNSSSGRISPSSDCVWTYKSKGKNTPKIVYFQLRTLPTAGDAQPRIIRSANFIPTHTLSIVSVVADNPNHKGAYSMMSFQFADPDKPMPTPPARD